MFSFERQVERLINRILKNISGTIKFKITFLDTTRFNQQEKASLYKDAATLGVPGAKSQYAAVLGLHQADIPGFEYLETELYDMDAWKPLVSGYTGGNAGDNDNNGRPPAADEELDAAGEATRGSDANANR